MMFLNINPSPRAPLFISLPSLPFPGENPYGSLFFFFFFLSSKRGGNPVRSRRISDLESTTVRGGDGLVGIIDSGGELDPESDSDGWKEAFAAGFEWVGDLWFG